MFPVFENANQTNPLQNIKIATDRNGAIVEITNLKGADQRKKKSVVGFLIDASTISNAISSFQIHYDELPKNSFLKLRLQGSNDLKNWTVIESEAVVAWFEMNGEKVTQDEIVNHYPNFKFYQLSNSSGEPLPKTTDVTAHFSKLTETQQVSFHTKKVEGRKYEDSKNEFSYAYDLNGNFPVFGIKVKFKDINSIAKFAIEASHSEKGPWQKIDEGTFFVVTRENKAFEKLDLNFSTNKFRFWKLKLVSDKSGMGSQFPEFAFLWEPQKLRFLARGSEPFMLAYGSSKATNYQNADLVNFGEKEFGRGQLQAQQTLGGPAQLIAEVKSDINYRKYGLWAVLLLGVLVIGTMALQVRKNTPT